MSHHLFRIAIISDGFPPVSNRGIGTSHSNLMKALSIEGYECRGFTFYEYGASSDANIERFGLPRWCYLTLQIIMNAWIISFRYLCISKNDTGRIRESAVAILGAISGLFLIRRLKAYAPNYIIIPDRGAISALWPRSLKARTFFVSHSNPLRFLNNPLIEYRSAIDARVAFWLEQKALNGCLAAICPSYYMKKFFLNSYVFNKKVFVLPNSINLKIIEHIKPSYFFEEKNLPPGTPIIYIPAAGNHNKGRQFTLKLVQRISNEFSNKIGFYLSGSLPLELQKCLEYAPHNAVILTPGDISHAQNLSFIKACSLCVSPTLIENFGMALLEAQALGLPVITFDVGGTCEIIENGITGYCKPLLDIDALIEATMTLLHDIDLLHRMSKAAKKRVAKLFSGEIIAAEFSDILTQLHEGPSTFQIPTTKT